MYVDGLGNVFTYAVLHYRGSKMVEVCDERVLEKLVKVRAQYVCV